MGRKAFRSVFLLIVVYACVALSNFLRSAKMDETLAIEHSESGAQPDHKRDQIHLRPSPSEPDPIAGPPKQ